MAEEDIAFNLDINTRGGAKSLSDLKKEFKELQSELSNTKVGTIEYQRTLEKLGAVKDDIGDLRDTINALNPEGKVAAFAKVGSTIASGFAAAQGAAALFGAESEELQKTMLKVQAAMALAEGIKGIVAAGDAFAVLGTVIKSNVISALTTLKGAIAATGLGALAVAIGVLIVKTQEYNEEIEEEYNKQKRLNDELKKTTEEYLEQAKASEDVRHTKEGGLNQLERELKLLEASGSTAEEIYKKKKQILEAELFDIKVRFKTVEGDNEAQIKLAQQIKDKKTEIKAIELAEERRLREINLEEIKKSHDKDLDLAKEKANLQKQQEKELDDYRRKIEADWRDEQLKNIEAFKRSKFDEGESIKSFDDELTNTFIANYEKDKTAKEKSEKDKQAAQQKTFDDYASATKQGLQAAQALTDLYFAHQLRQAKGNAEKEREIRKKAFNVNKAFGIANAVIDGVGAVQKALNNPYPLNLVLAIISGVLAAANVAKIATTKFDDGGNSSGSADIGSLGSTATAPTVQQPNNTVTQISDTGEIQEAKKPEPQRVFLVETDVTDSQKRVETIETGAKI